MHLTSAPWPRVAAPILLSLFVATEASATGRVLEISSQASTFEVAAQEIVTREVSNEVAVKEITPQEIARRNRARKEASSQQAENEQPANEQAATMEAVASEIPDLGTFLDRLMVAESAGRDNAANPLSSALGAFQFIKSTFLDVARRHFPEHCAELTDQQVLALRTKREFARSAAAAYTLENAAHLKAQGHEPTWPHLRLAFLLGPTGASKVIGAGETPLSKVLPASVLQANPFMTRMTATDLIARAAREVSGERHNVTARESAPTPVARPEARARPEPRVRPGTPAEPEKAQAPAVAAVKIRCNQKLVSCQRWVTLQKQKQKRVKTRNAEGASSKGGGKG